MRPRRDATRIMMARMQRSPLDWDDVRLFLALCRARTVGEAATALGIDASTVSRRLVTLEDALAATLFDRGRDGIAATESAEELRPVAEQIEDAMARFTTAAEGLERDVAGLVRITCPPDLAETVIAPLLPDLLERHPALRVDIGAGEALLDLSRREADVALRTVRPERGDLIVTKLRTVTWTAVASAAYARTLGALRAWTDARWIGWGERLAHLAPARWTAKHVKTEPVLRSDSLRMQVALVATGAGVALVPEPSVEAYGLVRVKIGAPLRAAAAEWPSDDLYLVTHRAMRDVPRVRVIWELLLGQLGERAAR